MLLSKPLAIAAAAVAAGACLALAQVDARADRAQEAWMSEAEMSSAFAGATLEGKYGDGRPFRERYKNDGRVEYEERSLTNGGSWSVQAGTFCTIYDGDASGGCFRVKQVGRNCYEFYFVARTEMEAHRDQRRPDWTARGSVVGKPGICQEESTV